MRDLDDIALERRLREVLNEHLGALPLELTVDDLDRRREARGVARRVGRGRGLTLLAAAALLTVGGALAAGSGILRRPAVVPPVPSPSSAAAVVAPSPEATSPSPSDLARPSTSPVAVEGPGGEWIRTGSMTIPRRGNVAVRLADGRVLVAGGTRMWYGAKSTVKTFGSDLTSAELYDPATATWSATGSMIHPGSGFATLLRDGRVLVGDANNGAELYDPATGAWSATSVSLHDAWMPTATQLLDGRVLIGGGDQGPELYDPVSGKVTATGKRVVPTYYNTTTMLLDGRVLAAGGDISDVAQDSADLYDPQTGSWTETGRLPATGNTRFDNIMATLLQDGRVLAVRYGSAALYDPATGTWTATARPPISGVLQSLTRLLDGMVLMTADVVDGSGVGTVVAEVYNPATGSWTKTGGILPPYGGPLGRQPATLLLDGTVLVAGGAGEATTSSAELYVPAGVSPPAAVVALPAPAATPAPTPTPSPTPEPTPFPPMVGPVPQGARPWTVMVINKRSVPATFDLAQEAADGIGPLCGSVTPNVVAASTTENVTFQLPPKGVECWIYINPGPGPGGPGFETSNKPMPGHFELTDGEGGPNGGGQNAWVSP